MHKPYTFAIRSKKPTALSKIAKEYVFTNASKFAKKSTKTQQRI